MGTSGVFAAEPISNFIGGIACFGTMMLTVWPELTKMQREKGRETGGIQNQKSKA